jgi:putative glutamine amidotransferase
MSRVLIGISASLHDFGDYGGVGIQRPLLEAGALPVTLPQLPEAIPDAVAAVDAIVLAPGRDIDPARYGQAPDRLLAAIEPRRDEFELALVPAALAQELPVLGVCRGMQVLNVALGGTLVQDVRLAEGWREHPSDPGWRTWKLMEAAALNGGAIPPHPRHPIAIVGPSILHDALGVTEAEVNSFHHQAIGDLGHGLRVTAVAPDGVVEAIELGGAGGGGVLAVQWEQQEEYRIDRRFTAVFDWLVAAAERRRDQLRGRRFSVS